MKNIVRIIAVVLPVKGGRAGQGALEAFSMKEGGEGGSISWLQV